MLIKIENADLRFNDNHSDRDGTPKGIILHHAAIDATIESIHRYHRDEYGWAGIGYHFYVTKDGVVYRGRPESWLGAHTVGFNDRIGICAEGDFENDTMSVTQQNAIVQLVAYLESKYGALEITRHRDHDATACPGKNYPFEEIIAAVRAGGKIFDDAKEGLVLRFQRAAMADGIELPQYGADGVWGLETASAASNVLLLGGTGDRVRLAQAILIERGYDLGQMGADGIWGAKTEIAVRSFQANNGLAVDGILGIETWKALLEVSA